MRSEWRGATGGDDAERSTRCWTEAQGRTARAMANGDGDGDVDGDHSGLCRAPQRVCGCRRDRCTTQSSAGVRGPRVPPPRVGLSADRLTLVGKCKYLQRSLYLVFGVGPNLESLSDDTNGPASTLQQQLVMRATPIFHYARAEHPAHPLQDGWSMLATSLLKCLSARHRVVEWDGPIGVQLW